MYEEPSFQYLPPHFLGELPRASWVQPAKAERSPPGGEKSWLQPEGWAVRQEDAGLQPPSCRATWPGVPHWDPGRGVLYER